MSKSKYTEKLKLEVMQYVLSRHSKNQMAKKFLIDEEIIQKWIDAYNSFGEEGLSIKENHPNKYIGNCKVHVIEYMYNNYLFIRQTAVYFNISSYTSVSQWKRKYDDRGTEVL